jgi:hypothetical protein
MAARRERERRRPPAEKRYRFTAPEAPAESDEALISANGDESTDVPVEPARKSRPTRGTATAEPQARSARAEVRTVRPFSAYASEYGYVVGDLRRVALVVGSLLLILILLYVVLPH